MSTPEQRRQLGAFLRARRERLAPADVGVHGGPARRRTPGLRREEVALLCGLSPTWYTWVEQGRAVSMSPAALARIAAALHFTAAERGYLFELAGKRDPAAAREHDPDAAPPELLAAIEAIAAPAYLLDRGWHARGANAAARQLLGAWLDGPEPNLLRWVFLDPAARELIADWDTRARRLVAEFRADSARRAADPEIAALVSELSRASERFAELWADHGVLAREGGTREFVHPADGRLRFRQVTLTPSRPPGYKLVMLVAVDGAEAE